MSSELSIAITSDENYLDGLVGTLAGIGKHSAGKSIRAVVLDCGIMEQGWRQVERTFGKIYPHITLQRLAVRTKDLEAFNPKQSTLRCTTASFARLLLPELLPDQNRIIYFDSDLHIDTDIEALFSSPLEGALVGAVRESHKPLLGQNIDHPDLTAEENALPAFNAGVLLMDLEALRRVDLVSQLRSQAGTLHGDLQDQSMLNFMLRRKWKLLPSRWNRQKFVTENFSIYRDHPDSIWHFIGKMKPWHFDPNHRRGLVADFYRNFDSIDWTHRQSGTWRPHEQAWWDHLKSVRALIRRTLQR